MQRGASSQDVDNPYISFEFFASLYRVRPGIGDSDAAKRRVGYRGKNRHAADMEGEVDACNKAFSIKYGLTQGVFNVVCPHVITLGFRCLFRAESVGEALSIVLESFPMLPRVIFYDVACKLDNNALRRVRPIMRSHGVRCVLDRPHSITHSCSPVYMPDESLGSTAGVATQAEEVSHSIAVGNWTSLAYMAPATYMVHKMAQVAMMNVRKIHRMSQANASSENDHVPLSPFYHRRMSRVRQRGSVCSCQAAVADSVRRDLEGVLIEKGFATNVIEKHGSAAIPPAGEPGVDDDQGDELDNSGTPCDDEVGLSQSVHPVPDTGTDVGVDHSRSGDICPPVAADDRHREVDARATHARFAPLSTELVTAEQAEFVSSLTAHPSLSAPVRALNKARATLSVGDLLCLRGEGWLNDQVMNSFVALINHRDKLARSAAAGDAELSDQSQDAAPARTLPRAFIFNTYFFRAWLSAAAHTTTQASATGDGRATSTWTMWTVSLFLYCPRAVTGCLLSSTCLPRAISTTTRSMASHYRILFQP